MNEEANLEVLRYAVGDWLFLSHIRRIVTSRPPTSQALEADIDATLEVLASLLQADYLEVGDVREADGFVRWQGTSDNHLARLRREWLEFGDQLNMGDVAWFNLTETGRVRLGELDSDFVDTGDIDNVR